MRIDERRPDPGMSRAGRRMLVAGLALVALAVAVFASRLGTGSEQGIPAVIGAPVPDLSLPYLEGEGVVELQALADEHAVLVLNFFASWCLQCRNEHADLISTSDAYRDRSVRFVGITFQDRPERSIAFLDELGRGTTFDYAVDPGSRAAIEFGIFGVPETVFISGGTVVGKLLGESDALTLSGALEQILAGEAVGARQVGEFRTGPDDRG